MLSSREFLAKQEMEWAPVVIKEIISAFRQQHSLQDNEKLKNIVREVMTENVTREQNKLLTEIMAMLNKDSIRNSREVDKTAMERDQLREECEKLNKEMEKLLRQDKKMEKKQENTNELSLRQKSLLQRVNELKKTNAGKGRSRSKHRNADGDGNSAANQSQGQWQGQQHSHGAISKYKHHPAMKGKANSFFPGNSKDGSRVPGSQHHPGPFISGQNTYGQPSMNALPHQGAGIGQQQYQAGGVGQQQYQAGGVGQQQYQGAGVGYQQYQGAGGGQQQYPHRNSPGFIQYHQNPQHYQQKYQISQPYSPNPGQPYQLRQDTQQQPQFGSTEAISQQFGGHQQFDNRRQFHKRGQFQHRGNFQHRGQSQHRGQFPHRGGFNQQRDNFQPKDRRQIKDDESLMSQFTPEELNVLKEMLKQKKLPGQQEENKDAGSSSQMKTGFKKKQKKKQAKSQLKKGEDGKEEPQKVNDSDDSGTEDDLDEMKKQVQNAYKAQLEAMESKESKAVQEAEADTEAKEPKAQNITCADEVNQSKEETAKETFDLCVASGVDVSKLQEGPELDAMLSNMVLVAKSDGQPATCQPKTVSELVEFKKKYPNAEVLVLK